MPPLAERAAGWLIEAIVDKLAIALITAVI
jgi:hypothetical protein